MKRILFEDVHELSNKMLENVFNDIECVSAVCHYELATALLSELIQSYIPIGQIDICDYELSGYDKEYIVTIMDGNIYCNHAYGRTKDGYSRDRYLESFADIAYIHENCNSKILKYIECDEIYEFSIDEIDNSEREYDECQADTYDDGTISYHSDSFTVSKDRYGKPNGFTRSWSITGKDGIYQSTTYSYYCDNEDMLRKVAKDFDVVF